MHDRAVLVNVYIAAVGQIGAVLPPALDALLVGAAVDGVDDDTAGDGSLARLPIVNAPLRERLVAGDEDGLQVGIALAPGERLGGSLDHHAAVLAPAVGGEREQLLGDPVEVGREREDLPDPALIGRQAVVPVLVERHLEFGREAVPLADGELVHDLPELGLRLADQAPHAPARVQEDGYLDERPALLRLLCVERQPEHRKHETTARYAARRFHSPASMEQ